MPARGKVKVFVGMSGGVDSSVAALLLKKEGYDVVGVFMRCYNLDGCAETDAEDARRVAEHIGIPFYVWNFEDEYRRTVVDYMIRGYKAGITPNPDVMCNKEIKFGLFFERARAMGADYVATGHYVRLRSVSRTAVAVAPAATAPLPLNAKIPLRGNRAFGVSESFLKPNASYFALLDGKDRNKDQSYFLWTLKQNYLAHCLFPIGEYLKPKVREIARKAGLPTAEKKDSQGICFLGKMDVGEFLKQHIPAKTGDVLALSEIEGVRRYEKIGTHDGAYFYTIGQRHLGKGVRLGVIGGRRGKKDIRPYYVAEKNIRKNVITIAEGNDNPALYQTKVRLEDVNVTDPSILSILKARGSKLSVWARVRYRQELVPATLSKLKAQSYKLEFNQPVKFVAPGQSAVFYLPAKAGATAGTKDMIMLGGGVIQQN